MLAHGTLHLFLSHARDLKSVDSNGFSDPYVKISLAGKEEVKSKVIYKNLNPRWSEVFTFTGVLKDLIAEPLSLRCKDKDTFTSGKLGEASVDLGGLARTRMVELQAQLSTQGTVYLRAFWQADGDSSPPADFTADVPAIAASPPPVSLLGMPRQAKAAASTGPSGSSGSSAFPRPDLPLPPPDLPPPERAAPAPIDRNRMMSSGMLKVLLHRGSGLKAADPNGKSDPYVIVRCGGMERKSKVLKKTLDPVWNEELTL
jgi:Ca2+-dependent lipid-binding protein